MPTEIYKLLTKTTLTLHALLWQVDDSLPTTVLEKGAVFEDVTVIQNIHVAARIFADLLVEKECDESYSVHSIRTDGNLANGGGLIFEAVPGAPSGHGSIYVTEPIRFAVAVSRID